ncbi:hypothetical protein HYV86_06975 [Candidatus Woesearchaeota archaeon]|nr:hypothetical protein [Candidatus Woesearchaeota archaeon]
MLVDNIIKKIQTKRQFRIPLCFLNSTGVKNLNNALESGVPLKALVFYRNFKNFYDLKPLKIISHNIEKRGKVSETDEKLIIALTKVKLEDPCLFFEISGNLLQVSTVLDDLKRLEKKLRKRGMRMKNSLRVSILLWSYVNLLELTNKYISEFLEAYLKKEKIDKESRFKHFLAGFKNGKHPEIGTTIDALYLAELISDKKNSILSSNHFVRNRLSHASMYYDIKQKKIFESNGKEYPVSSFKKDLAGLFNFLNEFVFRLNNDNIDIESSIDGLLAEICHVLLKIERSGTLKKNYQQLIFNWKRE